MKSYIEARAVELGKLMVKHNYTIRELAKLSSYSKSSVHTDLRERLPEVNLSLYHKVDAVLEYHINTRHIIGGEATKNKWKDSKRK